MEAAGDKTSGLILKQGSAADVQRPLLNLELTEPVPTGKHKLRFEFEVTGRLDIPAGKGMPSSTFTANWLATLNSPAQRH